ncbi:MAG: hypothetical protein HYT76_06295 [Deltaproteobacteria bacterium]|nr:hypothetical protein [Deltaproteobacteria bacterium]
MNTLNKIQKKFEEIYRLPQLDSVQDYLINEKTVRLNHPHFRRPLEETLLVIEKPSEIQIGLYIAEEILQRLEVTSPFEELGPHNLDDFCTAVEGVSHFLFVLTRWSQERSVSSLELELQAEVDKFVLCLFVLEKQQKNPARHRLTASLFENYHLVPSMNLEDRNRYDLANKLAWQYCHILAKTLHPLDRPELVQEIRRFHRKGLQDKIHILTSRRRRSSLPT